MCSILGITLGSIYSNQFKSQSDFYNHLQCVAKECNFSSYDEVVNFLFLTHNNNTRVHEDLLKENGRGHYIGHNVEHCSNFQRYNQG